MSEEEKIKGLAYYQLIGGIFGVGLSIWLTSKATLINGTVLLIIVLAFGLSFFSIYCGQQLLKQNFNRGLQLSLINQALQAINFAMLGYAFKFDVGFLLGAHVDLTNGFNLGLDFSFPTFQFNINSDNNSIIVGINLLAFYLIYLIQKLQHQIKTHKKTDEMENEILDSDLLNNKST